MPEPALSLPAPGGARVKRPPFAKNRQIPGRKKIFSFARWLLRGMMRPPEKCAGLLRYASLPPDRDCQRSEIGQTQLG